MISITISDETPNLADMAELLRYIAYQLDEGFTRGYYPHWRISGHEGA